MSEYKASGKAIEVSFRDLVPWIRVGERATHYLHSYPAKLLPQIAHFFLAANGWVAADARVLDPFGGTGTVALEANLSGRSALYADANPLARLITAAKTSPIDCAQAESLLTSIEETYAAQQHESLPWIVNVDLWYTQKSKTDLARLRATLIETPMVGLSDFVWSTFSATARKCSRANPRFAVPVRLKPVEGAQEREVWQTFKDQFLANLRRHKELGKLRTSQATTACAGVDARELVDPTSNGKPLQASSVDLILTSPPYAGAQKYVRASGLSLGWLGLTGKSTLKALENSSIGREHFTKCEVNQIPKTGLTDADSLIETIYETNPIRAAICANYLVEMESAIVEMARVLKPDGKAVVVIGDNTVCGHTFKSSVFLSALFVRHGMTLEMQLTDKIKSRGLLTKRSGGAVAIQSETILVFSK